MNDLNKKFKEDINQVDFSQETSDDIKKNILMKYKNYKKTKKIFVGIMCMIFVSFISIGIIYAEEIKETINIIASKVVEKSNDKEYHKVKINVNSKKELDYDAIEKELEEPKCIRKIDPNKGYEYYTDCYTTYTIAEIENILGIKLLKSEMFKEDKLLLYRIYRNEDNKVTYLEFRLPNIFQVTTKEQRGYLTGEGMYANWSIIIVTDYNDGTGPLAELAIEEKDKLSQHYIKNLDTTVSILDWSRGSYYNDKRYVVLEHDNIIYQTEIVSLDNSNTLDKDVKNLLDSLYY